MMGKDQTNRLIVLDGEDMNSLHWKALGVGVLLGQLGKDYPATWLFITCSPRDVRVLQYGYFNCH